MPPAWTTTHHACRFATGLLVTVALAGFSVFSAAPPAGADPSGSPQARAASLLSQIQALSRQEDVLSQRYDEANIQLQAAQQRIAQANQQLQAAQAAAAKARTVLVDDALSSYESGGESAGGPLPSANAAVVKTQYEGTLANTAHDDLDRYHLLATQVTDARVNLQKAEASAKAQVDAARQAQQANTVLVSQLQQAYNQVQGQVATLMAQDRAAQEAAAQQAAERRSPAIRVASTSASPATLESSVPEARSSGLVKPSTSSTTAASSTTRPTTSNPPTVNPPATSPTPRSTATTARSVSYAPNPAPANIPLPPGAAGAVAAAESQLGVPYEYGGASPAGFDCSGLVMWAYAQVGISLPHSSYAQAADTTPVSTPEPGDLVFYSGDSHVAMYIGGGQVVSANTYGTVVQNQSLYYDGPPISFGRVG